MRLVRDKGIVPVLHTHFYLLSFLAHVTAHSAAQCSSCICGPGSTYVLIQKLWLINIFYFSLYFVCVCVVFFWSTYLLNYVVEIFNCFSGRPNPIKI